MDRIVRISRIAKTHDEAGVCLRCGGETLIDGICMKCDAELGRLAAESLRAYATEGEIREWCCMHYIETEE